MGLRLPVFNRNQGDIRTAQADLVRSQAELERLELALRKRPADVFAQYESGWNAVREYRENILPETNEAFELYLESFRDRRAPWQQVILAQQDFFSANIDYVKALSEVRHANTRSAPRGWIGRAASPTGRDWWPHGSRSAARPLAGAHRDAGAHAQR